MLAAYQIINKILQNKDYGIIKRNSLVPEQFSAYKEQFQFIVEHYKKNGNIPDVFTFQSYFPNFPFVEVYETDDYLLDRLYEEIGYQNFAAILPELNQKLKEDSRLAYNFLKDQMQTALKPHTVCKGYDIIENAMDRYEEYNDKLTGVANPTISSGLDELDEVLNGWEYGDELVTIVGRTGEGKSWLAVKFLQAAWKQGKRVGLYSGEMNPNSIGYRFDTFNKNLSNRSMNRGLEINGYTEYIGDLKKENTPFYVITPKEIGGRPTVNTLRAFIEYNNLDLLCVDQMSLMEDCRANKLDPLRIRMGHIAEDLFQLSIEYKIPILLVAQANREATKKGAKEAPSLENIKESDDISHNSSKVIGIRKCNDSTYVIEILKNRNGISGKKLTYYWDYNSGTMAYIPTEGDAVSSSLRDQAISNINQSYDAITTDNNFVF